MQNCNCHQKQYVVDWYIEYFLIALASTENPILKHSYGAIHFLVWSIINTTDDDVMLEEMGYCDNKTFYSRKIKCRKLSRWMKATESHCVTRYVPEKNVLLLCGWWVIHLIYCSTMPFFHSNLACNFSTASLYIRIFSLLSVWFFRFFSNAPASICNHGQLPMAPSFSF